MKKKNCELCGNNRAIIYCESDEAYLCWDCDSKVHSANFLVAKHTRNLLCHSCLNLTPWTASGPKLTPTLSLCNSCIENPNSAPNPVGEIRERVEENYQTETDNDEDEDEYEISESEIDEYDDYDDDGNQVVPLSSSPSSDFFPPSPARSVSSSGSYGGFSAAGEGHRGAAAAVTSSPWKRGRENDCLHSEDEENKEGTSSSIGFLRPMKMFRTNELCE